MTNGDAKTLAHYAAHQAAMTAAYGQADNYIRAYKDVYAALLKTLTTNEEKN